MALAIARETIEHFSKKRKKMSKKLMNVVANQMSCNQLHDPSSPDLSPPRLPSMGTMGLEFEAEILWDYFELDRFKFLNAREERAGSTSREEDLEGQLGQAHGETEEEEEEEEERAVELEEKIREEELQAEEDEEREQQLHVEEKEREQKRR